MSTRPRSPHVRGVGVNRGIVFFYLVYVYTPRCGISGGIETDVQKRRRKTQGDEDDNDRQSLDPEEHEDWKPALGLASSSTLPQQPSQVNQAFLQAQQNSSAPNVRQQLYLIKTAVTVTDSRSGLPTSIPKHSTHHCLTSLNLKPMSLAIKTQRSCLMTMQRQLHYPLSNPFSHMPNHPIPDTRQIRVNVGEKGMEPGA